ncbi:MAG: type I Zorya anti-phage system protein ZorB1 [Atlantibacter hermannii]|uniref:type I Zorya anti-phage system protein ZorB1 n=1 Tax=Atlantibacter hermannii TaxID=565 RepID=UPI00290F6C3E|nr:type I Zorya anti-phage system protein ZorB1 [Atlantibacter hermannii]MDU7814293.1 type I Zorya anti-phage system protein ZorB1 [Atlantibacter hermannii]
MFGNAFGVKKRRSDEAEKPFWISYADLMTAMMVLFLVVMVASLSSVTQRIQRAEEGEKIRGHDIARLCERLELHARNLNKTIVVDCHDNRISFGEAGRFDHNRFFLNAEGQKALQDVVPLVLEASESEEGKKWFKQIVIEGFTDTDGSYLYNLHLSLQRSEWVMCSLLDSRSPLQKSISAQQQIKIRKLFLTGGVSFNNAKESKEASRRVELRMQFFGLKDKRDGEEAVNFPPVVNKEVCQLVMPL